MKTSTKIFKYVCIALPLALAIILGIYLHFGGLGTGESADQEELIQYAGSVEDIDIPADVRVIALGEATHGNVEFQQLKLAVLQELVEHYQVKALVLEGDYGGCEVVNRYIHGGEGTAESAAAAIGFTIYRTSQMAELIEWMRTYNAGVPSDAQLRFYGNDMQRAGHNCAFLIEGCERLGIDTTALGSLIVDDSWSDAYTHDERLDVIQAARDALVQSDADEATLHHADILLQNLALGGIVDDPYGVKIRDLRAAYMADNTLWALEQEESRGYDRILLCAHNGHVARYPSAYDLGSALYETLGSGYYAIGTGYYQTTCNLPVSGSPTKRMTRTVFSRDPIANAVHAAKLPLCYLDFAKIPTSSPLTPYLTGYHYMGSLGEGFSILHRLLPQTTREFQAPAILFNAMFYVDHATPTAPTAAN